MLQQESNHIVIKFLRDQEIYILYFFYKIQIRDSHSL